jgi:hypothetical protein
MKTPHDATSLFDNYGGAGQRQPTVSKRPVRVANAPGRVRRSDERGRHGAVPDLNLNGLLTRANNHC